MLIECITNNTSLISYWPQAATPVEELLKIGKVYEVYGLYLGADVAYEILLEEFDRHTTEFPSHLFKVIDNRLSSFFALGSSRRLKYKSGVVETVPFITFPEWANDENYFEKLINGDKEAEVIFDCYRGLLYLEYRHPEIIQQATMIQDNWVQCLVCAEAWELEHSYFEMCRCPNCQTILLNPYKFFQEVSE